MEYPRRSFSVYLQTVIPAFVLGRFVNRLSRSRRQWLKNLLIRGFAALYAVDRSEADARVPEEYPTFNAFFTRGLRPGVRPIAKDSNAIASPVDGTVQCCDSIAGDSLLQVKGLRYSLAELLHSEAAANEYRDGVFATLYLAPYDYHRVHMPCSGTLRRMVHVPGSRWSVNQKTVASVAGLFARNERLIFHFEGISGPFVLIMVGALNVSSISTAWGGELPVSTDGTGPAREHLLAAAGIPLAAGDYLAHFNLGSTVIVVFPQGAAVCWREGLAARSVVRVGERIGTKG